MSGRWVNLNPCACYKHMSRLLATPNQCNLTTFSCHWCLTGLSCRAFHHSEQCCAMKIRVTGRECGSHRTANHSKCMNKQCRSLFQSFFYLYTTSGYSWISEIMALKTAVIVNPQTSAHVAALRFDLCPLVIYSWPFFRLPLEMNDLLELWLKSVPHVWFLSLVNYSRSRVYRVAWVFFSTIIIIFPKQVQIMTEQHSKP